MKYTSVVTGGTFDKLHRGHRDFIEFVLSLGDKVILGLTSDFYVQGHKNGKNVASFNTRKAVLEAYFDSIHAKDRVRIVAIDDQHGPAISGDYLLDAIVVTEDTKGGADQVNKKRKELGLLPLSVEVFKMVTTPDGVPISSTRIRQEVLLLPPTLRALLQVPFGEVIYAVPDVVISAKTITVGDVTTKKFLDSGYQPFLSIIDNRIERKDIPFEAQYDFHTRVVRLDNKAATISKEIFGILEQMFQEAVNNMIIVNGEEDLLVLPVLLYAPLGFTVYYGQPHVGMIKIAITRDAKKRAKDIISQFNLSEIEV